MEMLGLQQATVVNGCWNLIVAAKVNGLDSRENGVMRGK